MRADDVQVPDGDRDVETVLLAHARDSLFRCRCRHSLVGPTDGNDGDVFDRRHAAHVADALRAALASQPAPTVSMVERLEAVHDTFGEDVSEDFCDGYLRAVLEVEVNGKYHGFAQLAPTVTGEAVARERERIATAIEARTERLLDPDRWRRDVDDQAYGDAMEEAARIARTSHEETK